MNSSRLFELLTEEARKEGFPLSGAVDLETVLGAGPFQSHVARYDRWIEAGYAGAMSYLVRGRDRRADPRLVFPEAQSVFCVAIPYSKKPGGATEIATGPRYARYIRGDDYHDQIAAGLEAVMKRIEREWSRSEAAPLRWKVCVDTSAVLERSWAALAGLGWIGKNTLLIHPKYGSYLFLAEVLINQRTGQFPSPLSNYCGNCTRCLDSCPTKAFQKPGILDSNRCISYWTLEKRGALEISEKDRRSIGPWIAGCDLCQEACPFNFKPARREETAGLDPSSLSLQGTDASRLQTWRALLQETEDEYRARVKNSALSRVKPAQFRRNLAIAISNAFLVGNAEAPGAASSLSELVPLVKAKLEAETDVDAKKEWLRCVSILTCPS